MDKDDKEKIAEILEESRRLKSMNLLIRLLSIAVALQAATIIVLQYKVHQLTSALIETNELIISLGDFSQTVSDNLHSLFELLDIIFGKIVV